jgi:hypothetical protein
MTVFLTHNENEYAVSESHFGWNVGYSDQNMDKYTISITSEFIQNCLGEIGDQEALLSAILDNSSIISAAVNAKGVVLNAKTNRFECRLETTDCVKG